ncbi:gibberellic acid methyltransferase 2 [Selaginella moellendorffii]|uniref:gibberellic acid methyltransferase 2 n=1 Tax=Selaginella moellendorffii TaxID=88036 RepID=UPI000D1C6D3D|nr:gibberellic acid methyltransferase 2 [Selaginella moellendorffii]|eukprot:XP_024535270.1 gibberellic acid methyltransferase 2 [Selaginella moellendorffii]
MEGGVGISSYSRNSSNQGSAFLLIAPALRAAIAAHDFADHTAAPIRIADLGCAVGSNTITAVAFVIKAVRDKFKSSGLREPELQALFSDLVSNDFNTLFQHLEGADFFVAGVPGSFYHRLFPSSSIHFSMCNVALQWLSKASVLISKVLCSSSLLLLFQVPAAVADRRSSSWNAGRITAGGSAPEVARAFASQAHEDLCRYLACRAEETVPGGLVTFFVSIRSSSDPAEQTGGEDCSLGWMVTCLEQAWNDLVLEGLIDEETRDSFNIPAYHRTLDEIAKAVSESGDVFTILQLEELKCPMPTYASVKAKVEAGGGKAPTPQEYAGIETMAMKSTMKKQIEAHLKTPDLVDALFKRLKERFLPKEPYVPARHVKMALAILERRRK